MEKIKQASVEGIFYPKDKDELYNFIQKIKTNDTKLQTRAVIVPHAGLIYSGILSYKGINSLDKNLKTLFIFAPAHKVGFDGIGISNYDYFSTPLGNIELNKEILNDLIQNFGANYNDKAFEFEHSIEVELPIIQTLYKEVKIVPVLIGNENFNKIESIISKYWENKDTGFIISSDLSHFLSDKNALELDLKTADMIETLDFNNILPNMACGITGILGLLLFAKKNGHSLIRLDMRNSSLVNNDKSRVVGYGVWGLYEGEKNNYLKEYYSDFIIKLARISIKQAFVNQNVEIKYDRVFDEKGASFVTLEKNGNLRGCIGSIIQYRPLIKDLIMNAKSSAFNDPRFTPVIENEIEDIKINVSLLSSPSLIEFKNEKELLDKINKDIDGIIIQDGNYRAVYLPSVWEQIKDKKDFLNSLKQKAGLPYNYFSDTFKAYRFHTTYIKEF